MMADLQHAFAQGIAFGLGACLVGLAAVAVLAWWEDR